ncbi:riboflavin synthase [Stappia taiwanensis]|uniref:Riboflavin synthase n=1 Tax=Stappia taiwanensis TaxID=992267 RepID=A0A838XNM2_9HYPH|nr:riboflavin synthase [Stappia taiwanensis]MBA4610216.1 riboflavin synthase [Stappia taiwanensis]GGE77821.1 riboflavin synthase subunit alpha [Stappia taiwanensis]
MFTGIVTDIGRIAAISEIPAGLRTRILTVYDPDGIALGASIACNGVCHTVTAKGRDAGNNWFEIESAAETLQLTTVPSWKVGDRLNLERSLAIGDELGGHIVQGHVDGTAEIIERTDHPESAFFRFKVPADCAPFIAKKGGVALDGTSLTVNDVDGDTFSIFLIPHTLAVTTWGERKRGDRVNLEVDMMARYAARLAQYTGADSL